MSAQLALLQRMQRAQQESMGWMMRAAQARQAGDAPALLEAARQRVRAGRDLLDAGLAHARQYGPALDTPSLVKPLADGLLELADHEEWASGPEAARALRDEAMALARQHLGDLGVAQLMRSLASRLVSEGRYPEALDALAACRETLDLLAPPVERATVRLDAADALQWLGDAPRARAQVREALDLLAPLAGRARAPASLQDLMANLGAALMDGGASIMAAQQQARARYLQALVDKLDGRFQEADEGFRAVLSEHGGLGAPEAVEFQRVAILAAARPTEALALSRRLEPVFLREGPMRPKRAALLNLQAKAHLALGDARRARALADEAVADLARFHDPDLLWRLHETRARARLALGDEEDAFAAFQAAADAIDGLRRAPLGHRLDSLFLSDKTALYGDAIALAARLGRAEACLRLMESVKSRLLALAVGLPPHDGAGDETAARYDALCARLDALDAANEPAGSPLRRALAGERAALLERMRLRDPRWRALTAPPRLDAPHLLALLRDRRQAALTLHEHRGVVTSVLLKDGQARVARQEIPPDVRERLAAYAANLQKASPDKTLYDPFYPLCIGARHFVPPDLLREALSADSLLVAPHGTLHLLPWAGLVFEQRRLFEWTAVAVAPNLGVLLAPARPPRPARAALVGAPAYPAGGRFADLGAAPAELDALRRAYEASGALAGAPATGKDATEARFWALARGDATTLHVACHGTLDADEPMSSALHLADSAVEAAEIVRRGVSADEVVLSACSTGWRPTAVQGVALAGDDALGLPGALLEAGARFVLASVPPADDAATARLMQLYHEQRLKGAAPPFALREAQRAMLAEGAHEPYKWVGFTLHATG